MKESIKRAIKFIAEKKQAVTLALIGAACFLPTTSKAVVTLPETGVDVGGYVTALITDIGIVVGVVVGGYFAFLLIKKAMGWGRKAV